MFDFFETTICQFVIRGLVVGDIIIIPMLGAADDGDDLNVIFGGVCVIDRLEVGGGKPGSTLEIGAGHIKHNGAGGVGGVVDEREDNTKNGDEEGGKGVDDDKDERESAGFMPNSPSGGAIR